MQQGKHDLKHGGVGFGALNEDAHSTGSGEQILIGYTRMYVSYSLES